MSKLTQEQIYRILIEGTRDLSIHDGKCEVLEALYNACKDCDKDGEPWIMTAEQAKLWAKEYFNISLK